MMKLKLILLSVVFSVNVFSSTTLPTVDYVDLSRFVGKWYSVTSLPQFFNKGCLYQTAEYGVKEDGNISVFNSCIKKNKIKTIKGTAFVDNTDTNADLTVQFKLFWSLFTVNGDYKVIALDADYNYIMVGGENRKSLWIMSRTKGIPADILADYKQLAEELGFRTEHLVDSIF